MRHKWEWKTFGSFADILAGKGVRKMYCVNCDTVFDKDNNNYHEKCDKTQHPVCCDCDNPAAFIRHTQFAGSHPYCETHARAEDDFDPEDWEDLRPHLK